MTIRSSASSRVSYVGVCNYLSISNLPSMPLSIKQVSQIDKEGPQYSFTSVHDFLILIAIVADGFL